MKPEVAIFDVSGTLLDLGALESHFTRWFGAGAFREEWFEQLQVVWMTAIACGTYRAFGELAAASLRMLAAREAVEVTPADELKLRSAMEELPPFSDVHDGLIEFRRAGFRVAALANGSFSAALAQMKFAKLDDLLETVLSVEQVRRYRPAPEPYLYACKQLDVDPESALLVTAHAWDLAGARAAGLQTAFVARPRQTLNPAGARPDYQAADLVALAKQLA